MSRSIRYLALVTEPSPRTGAEPPRRRLRADERRAQLLEAALRVFAQHSYAGATTAMIAREAGVSEPVIYQHFRRKADLYSSCLDAAWDDLRERWDAVIATEPDAARWIPLLAEVGLAALEDQGGASRLWLHAMSGGLGNDDDARPRIVAFTRELHGYVSRVVRTAQDLGGLSELVDPDAEAWLFLSVGMLRALSQQLDGIVDDAFPQVLAARQAWYDTR